jgi:hypothetical protein
MFTSWKTTLFGGIVATCLFLGQQGVKLGHIGNTDVIGLVQSVATLCLGAYAQQTKIKD